MLFSSILITRYKYKSFAYLKHNIGSWLKSSVLDYKAAVLVALRREGSLATETYICPY
jgi:hypothetical protein